MNRKYLHLFAASILLILLSCACSGLVKPSPQRVPDDHTARPHQAWDRAFTRDSGWTGADVASSLVIPGNRVLWIFGDTWIGDVRDNRHLNATLVNNSLAVHAYDPNHPGKAAAAQDLNFYWGPLDQSGKPTAWIKPEGRGEPKCWYWPTGGAVVISGPDRDHRLALFLILLTKKQGPDSVWGFECIGSAVALIENVEEPVSRWTPRVIELPHIIERGAVDSSPSREVDWGVAALEELSGGTGSCVYIYGVEPGKPGRKDLILARVRPESFEDFGQWEFFSGNGAWSGSRGRASHVVTDVASELSVDRLSSAARDSGYVMVYSEPVLADRILVRSATSLEGPWSDVTPVFTVAGLQSGKGLFTYAAKGHAALSDPGTLLVSYIINSNDLAELAGNASIYRPRFINIPLAGIGLD